MNSNPLASGRPPPQQVDPALMRHAQMWGHMQGQDADGLQAHIATIDHILPVIGALAGNPKTTAKDVIKAMSGTVADGKASPSVAVKFISDMPADKDQLGPWLRDRYALNLASAVHAKAALMGQTGAPRGAGIIPPSAPVMPQEGPMQ